MRALLDVNVLIALMDPDHQFHETAKAWFVQNAAHGWATCPLTQNACVRILSQPAYSNPVPVGTAIQYLQGMCAAPSHHFVADQVSLLDPVRFNYAHIHSSKQLTDLYLLALAVKHSMALVTFDGRIPRSAVRGARAEHLVTV